MILEFMVNRSRVGPDPVVSEIVCRVFGVWTEKSVKEIGFAQFFPFTSWSKVTWSKIEKNPDAPEGVP
jgi:hypothetical protein